MKYFAFLIQFLWVMVASLGWALPVMAQPSAQSLVADGNALVQVRDVQLEPQANGEEWLKIELSKAVSHQAFVLENPPRAVIDLPPFHWRVDAKDFQNYKGKLVANIRYARYAPQTSRIVLDLNKAVLLQPDKNTKQGMPATTLYYRLIPRNDTSTTVAPPPPQNATQSAKTSAQSSPEPFAARSGGRIRGRMLPAPPSPPPPPVPSTNEKPQKLASPSVMSKTSSKQGKPLIVIDAGHGGKDPGTIGRHQTREKNVTLTFAHALKQSLEKTGRFQVALTRADDRFILLRERFQIAKRMKADLFLSLHADSALTPTARGLSFYTLSEDSSDAEAAALAEKENKADLLAGVDLVHQDDAVADILIDLTQRDTKEKSIILASHLVGALRGKVILLPNPHRFAGFAVLKSLDIPSALIEVGFLSHPQEESDLLSKPYRQRIVDGLTQGIGRYFDAAQ
jgi:N-acetylmuramoyl-L-alanine amidase